MQQFFGLLLKVKWLGGSDNAKEGNYVWNSSGASLNYTNWAEGEPNGGTRENCIKYWSPPGKWNDGTCDSRLAIFCEVLFQCN